MQGNKNNKWPVTVLSGFLATGKIAVLSRLFHNHEGKKVAGIVNDKSEINIDSAIVQNDVYLNNSEEKIIGIGSVKYSFSTRGQV